MKINEVEQLVGITKKNIRFYEDQGLIGPARNKANGYREYSDEDVQLLLKIKLLRKLSIPIEEIRHILEGRLTLSDCLERHQIFLNHEAKNLERAKELCRSIAEEVPTLRELSAAEYLDRMTELEEGGNRFMNVTDTDVIMKKKKRGAIAAAAAMVTVIILWDIFFIILCRTDPAPLPVVLFCTVPPTLVVIGVLIALRARIKEIDKGEENEASKY